MTEYTADIVIAGAGLSGVLCAHRVAQQCPDKKILLIDREAMPGGRLRTSDPGRAAWSYGLNYLSRELYTELLKELTAQEADFAIRQSQQFGVLSANKVSEVATHEVFTKKGARALGGLVASKDWQLMDDLRASFEQKSDTSFQNAWPGNRKSASAVVLEQMVPVLGIPDLWSTSVRFLIEKIKEFGDQRWIGDWESLLQALIAQMPGNVSCVFSSTIVGAQFEEKNWRISMRGGVIHAQKLVIAQSPWDALFWLPKKFWPPTLLQFAVKAKPVSVVVLSEVLEDSKRDFPDLCLIPAEEAHAVLSPTGDLCFQTTIDYEISLQAPDVVKAVKRLKRARRKLQAAVPELVGKGEHLALVSVAWSQSPAMSDRRFVSKMTDRHMNSEHLLFCGDSYGRSACGDTNILQSIASVVARLSGQVVHEDVDVVEMAEESSAEVSE